MRLHKGFIKYSEYDSTLKSAHGHRPRADFLLCFYENCKLCFCAKHFFKRIVKYGGKVNSGVLCRPVKSGSYR